MSFLKLEQITAVAKAALETEGGLPTDDLSLVMMSPPFTVAMYLDKFCELINKTQDFSRDNQMNKAAYIIRDTIKHRWKKHLKPLKINCRESFIYYCADELQKSKCIIKTLSDCLLVMVVFENTLAYSSLGANDPFADISSKFRYKLENEEVLIEDLFNLTPKYYRGDDLIDVTFNYYKRMCEYSYKDFADIIFKKS